MRYGIKYHLKVKDDIAKLDGDTKKRIKKAIEKKLIKNPEIFGERLRGTLKDFWKFRVGSYRVVSLLEENKKEITVLGIFSAEKPTRGFRLKTF